jgi:hypothetical protein
MLKGLNLIQIVNDQNKCVHTTFGHPKIKTSRVVANSRFGSTCKSMVFVTIVRNTCSTKDEWEGNIVCVRTLMQ